MAATFRFGEHIVQSSVAFFRSPLCIAFVNRKPVLPGHILVSTHRVVERFKDLTNEEVCDLFTSTQTISRVLEKVYGCSSLTVAIQDGPDAGQTVKHVHIHILPRKPGDFEKNDDVYEKLEKHDKKESGFRGLEEMSEEAARLAKFFQ